MSDQSQQTPAPDAAEPDAPAPAGRGERRAGATGATPWGTLSGRVISLVSRKGGVGKTTSAANLGACFALSGHAVLLVGVDPQCGLARTFGHGRFELDSGLLDIFQSHVPLNHLAYPTALDNLSFVTPNVWTLDEEERYKRFMEQQVDAFVRAIDRARNLYDTILIDCPPGLGAETRAALLASDSYLVPVQAEELCRDSLGRLLAFVEAFREQAFAESSLPEGQEEPAPLTMEGMFLTMTAARTRTGREVTARVQDEYGASLFATGVPRATRVTEMALRGKPVVIYDRRSPGSRAYFDLMDEIVERYHARREAQASSTVTAAAGGDVGPGNGGGRPVSAGGLSALGAPSARLLADLRAALDDEENLWPGDDNDADLELVSLDDLLAEEERAESGESADEEWEGRGWGDHGRRDRLH